ncbi:MAG: 1-phosphofructokinase family hexose kinase [Paracoccaceae bacterium]
MQNILTITLNPTVDMASTAPDITAGPKIRCTDPVFDPGGGGINVARAIHHLGGHSEAFIPVGGATGHHLLDLLRNEGLRVDAFTLDGETRQSISVTQTSDGQQFRFVMPGPDWSDATLTAALAQITRAARKAEIIVLSGSQPPGVPDDFAARLTQQLDHKKLIVDTSGAPQKHVVDHPIGLFLLRMDAAEAESLNGQNHPTPTATADFAAKLVSRNVAEIIVIGRGADGSTCVTKDFRLHCRRPVEKTRSRVGAGDSMLGAMVLELARGSDVETSLRYGVAASSAAVLTDATQLCTREDTDRLLPGCEMIRI